MKTTRRRFLKQAAIVSGLIFVPTDLTRPGLWLYDKGLDEFVQVPLTRHGGLQAASTIKSRTFSSVVDNRIQLSNSNFARLWSASLGTSWTTVRVACRISMEDSGAALTSTPVFGFGMCSGTSNIFLDSTTTHWLGFRPIDTGFQRFTSPANYLMNNSVVNPTISKKVTTTFTNGTGGTSQNVYAYDCTTANRSVLAVDITKGSPFTCKFFSRSTGTASDVDLATYLAQIVLVTPTVTNHALTAAFSLTVDEPTSGYFNAINAGWDRTSPAIELSDIAVVRLS